MSSNQGITPFTQLRYRTSDGSVFDELFIAETYEERWCAVGLALALLGPRPTINGGEYVQHDAETVWIVREKFLRTVIAMNVATKAANDLLTVVVDREPLVWVLIAFGRHMDNDILDKAWFRLCCIDNDGREWQQPYYTTVDAAGERATASARGVQPDGGAHGSRVA